MSDRSEGFEYLQRTPHEAFRVPDKTDPIQAACALLAFAASPIDSRMRFRHQATEALLAWIRRRYIAEGAVVPKAPDLSRNALAPRLVRSRVYKVCRLFEREALHVANLAAELSFRRTGGYRLLGGAIAAAFRASHATIKAPRNFGSTSAVIQTHLRRRLSTSALLDEGEAVKSFRRRQWSVFIPAAPMMLALDRMILKWNASNKSYDTPIPGYGKRSLAICLLRNPQIWIPDIVECTALWTGILRAGLPGVSFPTIYGEDPTSEQFLSMLREGVPFLSPAQRS